jgi:hypothetical protein
MARQLLTDFELMILLAILRVGENAYGVPIAEEIERTGGRRAVLGAVYTALERLERNGWVSSTVGEPTPSAAAGRSGSSPSLRRVFARSRNPPGARRPLEGRSSTQGERA